MFPDGRVNYAQQAAGVELVQSSLGQRDGPKADRMSNPTILSVDDDPLVAAAITRDLSRQYGAEYRVVSASS